MIKEFKVEIVASDYILPLFDESSTFKVDKVFETGFNIVSNEKLLFVSGEIPSGHSPIGIQIRNIAFNELLLGIEVGNRVKIGHPGLIIYARPTSFLLQIQAIKTPPLKIETITWDAVIHSEVTDNLRQRKLVERSGFNEFETLQQIHDAFMNHSLPVQIIVEKLIGAGIGLTPSGDDYLQAAMIMEAALNDSMEINQAVQASLTTTSTTNVSYAYYQALKENYINESWVALLKAIQAEQVDEVDRLISRIELYGHTSGKDMLLGAFAYLENYRNRER